MPKVIDLTNKNFGRLVALRRCGTKNGRAVWLCRCVCGNTCEIKCEYLLNGQSKSCGCLKRELTSARSRKHGQAGVDRTITYTSWLSMRRRCLNSAAHNYKDYGGRGIRICARWLKSFNNFLDDMGERPSRVYSIEREENDGHYEPDNCYWATKREQAYNRRKRTNAVKEASPPGT